MAPKNKLFAALLAVVLAASVGFADGTSAASNKKLTYEEAYARCKAIMDKEGTPGTSTQSNVRHTRGAACMKKYGHKL
jgi:opacity protein-like surface antigen